MLDALRFFDTLARALLKLWWHFHISWCLTEPEHHLTLQQEGGGYAGACNIPDASIHNPTYIIYNPTTNALSNDIQFQPLAAAWPVSLYPFMTILPYTGSVFAITGAALPSPER